MFKELFISVEEVEANHRALRRCVEHAKERLGSTSINDCKYFKHYIWPVSRQLLNTSIHHKLRDYLI